MHYSSAFVESFGDNLIFLISQPRAGSTMLQRILGAHPDIHTVSEPWIALHPLFALRHNGFAADFDPRLANMAVTGFLRELPEGSEAYCEGLRRMLGYLYGCALQNSGKSIFLDKTPRYYFIIPELRRVFPRGKIVFLLRNPVAVLSSILESWCTTRAALEVGHARHDLMDAPSLILEGIHAAGPDAIVARYEEIVGEPETALRQLCDRLKIAFHPAMIEYGAAGANQPRWSFGDQNIVYRERSPIPGRADRWRKVLKVTPSWAAWARGYLDALGAGTIRGLGYDFDQLCSELPRVRESHDWSRLMHMAEPRSQGIAVDAAENVHSATVAALS